MPFRDKNRISSAVLSEPTALLSVSADPSRDHSDTPGVEDPWLRLPLGGVHHSQDTKSSEPSSLIKSLAFPERLFFAHRSTSVAPGDGDRALAALFAPHLSLRFPEGITRVNPQPWVVVATLLNP
jgi:hypothetical protein